MLVALDPQNGERTPLGVVHVKTIFESWDKSEREAAAPENERWKAGITGAAQLLKSKGLAAVHVADRESDSYHLLADLSRDGHAFVLRVQFDRRVQVETATEKLFEQIGRQPMINVDRTVRVNARKPAELAKGVSSTGRPALRRAHSGRPAVNKAQHPPRWERTAHLSISVGNQTLKRPPTEKTTPEAQLPVNVVRVFEPNPPPGCEPVDWMLFTSEPVNTAEQALRVVDLYRARWLIEEFFKALKTGCGYEKLQLEKRRSFLNALAVYMPIAWLMLRLRAAVQTTVDEPADAVLTPSRMKILRTLNPKLAASPTLRQALLAIAKLGGHIKNNGDPGWQTLGRGMERLLEAERILQTFGANDVINP